MDLFRKKKHHTLQTYKIYNVNVMRQSGCLVFYPIMIDDYASTGGPGVRLHDVADLKLLMLFGLGLPAFCTSLQISVMLFGARGSSSSGSLLYLLVLLYDSSW